MDYKEKYEMALEGIQEILSSGQDSIKMSTLQLRLRGIFPELRKVEDEKVRKAMIDFFKHEREEGITVLHYGVDVERMIAWLEKRGEQRPTENKGMNLVEEEMTPFQKKVFCIIDATIEEEQGLKQVCDELLALASNEIKQKPVWSEDDKNSMYDTFSNLTELKDRYGEGYGNVGKCIDWLKSLKDRMTWKPSGEHIRGLIWVINRIMPNSEKANEVKAVLEDLLEQLKKIREE